MGPCFIQTIKMKTWLVTIFFFGVTLMVRAKEPNCIESYIGDGYCDDDNNNDACQFDGGDCCNQSTIQWNMYCYECECLTAPAESTTTSPEPSSTTTEPTTTTNPEPTTTTSETTTTTPKPSTTTPVPTTTTTTQEPCPDGWVDGRQIGAHGACYLFANDGDGLNWNEAKEYCTSNGGYLTDILDQETQDFIAVTSENFPGITWWIGGNDFDKAGKFTWLSGEFVDFSSWNVDTGEPNGDGHCIHISNMPEFNLLNWNWNDINCDMKTVSNYKFRPLCKICDCPGKMK